MATWYEVRKFGDTVEAVDVVKETAKQLTIRVPITYGKSRSVDRVHAKVSEYSQYFPTFEAANTYLIERLTRQLEYRRKEVADLEIALSNAMTLGG